MSITRNYSGSESALRITQPVPTQVASAFSQPVPKQVASASIIQFSRGRYLQKRLEPEINCQSIKSEKQRQFIKSTTNIMSLLQG